MNRRTSAADLIVAFLLVGVLCYLLLRVGYESLPPFQWFVAIALAILAAVEFVVARRVRHAVGHRPDARPMTAIAIARSVALGKASALVGSALVGAGLALVIVVAPDSGRTTAAGNDLQVGIGIGVASLLLTAAGITLERAGVAPEPPR